MAIKLNASFLNGFVGEHELDAMEGAAKDALFKLQNKTGLGSDFLGWLQVRLFQRKETPDNTSLALKGRKTLPRE